ncbi:hypothetical protein B9G55_05850 [Saccharibacillus sp. O16]|nr:hypothetical protein B9G55_05850 [Saccharibacillus sp. O16]
MRIFVEAFIFGKFERGKCMQMKNHPIESTETASTNLIDLMSEKHLSLRRSVADLDGEVLNRTETHILAIVEQQGRLSISDIGRAVSLSRQGTHKSVLGLIERGYLTEIEDPGNRRDRRVFLTDQGKKACEDQLAIKEELERRITEKIGAENVQHLKHLLLQEWLDR